MGKVELDNSFISKVYIVGIDEDKSPRVLYLSAEKKGLIKKQKIIDSIPISDQDFNIIKKSNLKEFYILSGLTKTSEQDIAIYNIKTGQIFKYLLPDNYFNNK